MSRLETILTRLGEVARQEIRKDFREDSCIGSTRVVSRVLKHFGYVVKPFPCIAAVYNKPYADALMAGRTPPDEPAARERWLDLLGAWSVGVGAKGPGQENAVGHLVAVLPEHLRMVDASLDQCNRPHKGIFMPPCVVAQISEKFLAGEEKLEYAHHGCRVVYEATPNENQWRVSSNWTNKAQTKRAMKAIIRYIEAGL
jgi:hypothetical protein